jgi:hypothetical protein
MKNRILSFLAVFFGSLCFGLLFIVIFINATELDCTRQLDNSYSCRITKLFFGKYQISQRDVDNITDITMEDDGCSDGCSYRAEFITSNGNQQPLNSVYTDRAPVARQVNTIKSQMASRSEKIVYRADPPWWVLFLVGGLTLMGMFFAFPILRKR